MRREKGNCPSAAAELDEIKLRSHRATKAARVHWLPSHAQGIATMFGAAARGLSKHKPRSTLGWVKEMRPIRPEINTLGLVKAVVPLVSLGGQLVLLRSGVLRNESWCNKTVD